MQEQKICIVNDILYFRIRLVRFFPQICTESVNVFVVVFAISFGEIQQSQSERINDEKPKYSAMSVIFVFVCYSCCCYTCPFSLFASNHRVELWREKKEYQLCFVFNANE